MSFSLWDIKVIRWEDNKFQVLPITMIFFPSPDQVYIDMWGRLAFKHPIRSSFPTFKSIEEAMIASKKAKASLYE